MCLTRPGYKADGAEDGDRKVQWRLDWGTPGHEHRVAVKPGTSSDTLCSSENKGPAVCKEVAIGDCPVPSAGLGLEGAAGGRENDQIVLGGGDL